MSYLSLPELTRSLWKVWFRNKDVFMKTFMVNFIPSFIQPLLYLFAFGFGVGNSIDLMDGVSYIRFIAPALIAVGIMEASFFECTFASYVRMYYQKTFEAIIATPLSIEEVIAGELLWGATKSVVNTIIMLPIFAFFGIIDFPSSLLLIPFSFLAGLLFAAIGMCFTAISPSIDTLNYPTFLFITPMFLFSGTFFSLSLMPDAIRYFALAALPLTHVVIIIRSLTLTRLDPFLYISFVWIIIATLIFFVLSINLMKKRLIV
ncbi:MAG: ABC transporter permease [Candidatus Methanoperedens sp.]|nr:ABC transporter permease [Candidatus Methanoperedens sp.]